MKNIFVYTLIVFELLLCQKTSAFEVLSGLCEMSYNPMAVSTMKPRFTWILDKGTMQSAYEIEVYYSKLDDCKKVWSTGKVMSSESHLIYYEGNTLAKGEKYKWRVRVWNEDGELSEWSKEYSFMTSPDNNSLHPVWIGAITKKDARIPEGRKFHGTELKSPENKAIWNAVDTLSKKSIYLRKSFSSNKQISEAIAYVCGLGFYEFSLNGNKVGDYEFAPLWTDYDKTVYYNVFDVTSMLRKGENVVGILLGNGFYNVQGGRYRKLQISFGAPTLFFRMRIRYIDGTEEFVSSDSSWKYSMSPITFNCIYGGEDYDARLEQPGWNKSGFNDISWKPVVVQEAPKGKLLPQQAEPVKIMEYFDVKSVNKLSIDEVRSACKSMKREVDPSALVFDMGQNLAGFPEISLRGKRGQKVTLVVGESLTEEGAVNQKQTGRQHYYQYTLKGEENEVWHPRFSYYGFRYIQVEGAVLKDNDNSGGLPVINKLRSCFVYNSASSVGKFECSNRIFNSAHTLINRAVRSNMQSVFTDCPHREKLGWLEQNHLNGPGLLFNYNLVNFIPKLMQDMSDAQYDNGMQPTIAPQYVIFEGKWLDPFLESPEWGSAIVLLPFLYAEYYGDISLIEKYYYKMKKYVDYLSSKSDNHILTYGLGDWYDYGDFRAGFSRNTPVSLVATAHYYMDICKMSEAAAILGNRYDETYYRNLSSEVKKAFNTRFFNKETRQYGSGSQCSNSLPLYLRLVDDEYKEDVINNLIQDIHIHGDRLTTGDVGNRYLFQTLAANGRNELMYKMHNHEDVPGYGFQLKFGATTLTEQWDPRKGASWNHFMMGQIDEWFYSSLAGIGQKQGCNGFKEIEIRPCPVGDLKWVNASYTSVYGDINVSWKIENKYFILHVDIPANTTAEIWLPGEKTSKKVKSGHYKFKKNVQN